MHIFCKTYANWIGKRLDTIEQILKPFYSENVLSFQWKWNDNFFCNLITTVWGDKKKSVFSLSPMQATTFKGLSPKPSRNMQNCLRATQ